MSDKKPKSPCVKHCKIDKVSGFCVGCKRTRSEISGWKRLSVVQRQEVLQAIELRRASAKTMPKGGQPRKALAKGLCRLLADTHALALKTHGLRWNLAGPLSAALGAWLDEQRADLGGAADQLAQRIRVLGATVPDGLDVLRRLSSLQQAARRTLTARALIRQHARDQAATAEAARSVLAAARSADDGAIAELLTLRVQAHDHAAKTLRALVRQEPAPPTG